MKKIIKNNIVRGTFGRMQKIDDFLPPPEKLVLKKPQTVKISLVLDQMSIDFFKSEAKRLKASYQNMIRNLLQEYVKKMKQSGR